MLSVILSRAGYEVVTAADGEEALEVLSRENLSIVLCDVRMPRLDGLGFLDRLTQRRQRRDGGAPIHTVMMSAYGSMELAIEAMKRGAYDYISKPFKADEILLTLRKVEEREKLTMENQRLRGELLRRGGLGGFLGQDGGVNELLETVRKVAAYPTTVLITGESGTGKEVLARELHGLSDRSGAAFVAVNCGAIPENLLESELFGHEKGAFTGAVRSRAGLFEQAHRGTLLLDELGEMPLSLQVKLLRVLETRLVRRVGGSGGRAVDVRVIAATSRDLTKEVDEGRFRKDLFFRLNVVHLRVPPLRERPDDIPLLANHFVEKFNQRLGRRVRGLAAEALRTLIEAPWPGNVRQLENAMERAVLLCAGDEIGVDDLPLGLNSGRGIPDEEDDLSIKRRSASLERDLIQRAMARTGGNRTQAARLLEISYKALAYKIRDYGLEENR